MYDPNYYHRKATLTVLQKRNLIRLTAKATQFGRKTFTSWLIEAAGTVPIKRRKDTPDVAVDNSDVMENLKRVNLLVIFRDFWCDWLCRF